MGKPITQSREELQESINRASLLKQFSESEMKEDVLFQANGVIKKTFLEPMGTVLALLPWDFPVLETVNIVVPAILAGNSVLLKDNPDTPTIANHFEKALEQLSPGVAQKFFIDPMEVFKLYSSKSVNYVVFAGTYQSALDIYTELGQNDFIDCNFDLGGKNIAYIDNSCSQAVLDRAIEKCMWGTFYNTGQSRSRIESILVHKDLVNKVTNQLSEMVLNTFKLDDPNKDSTNFGCINFSE